MGTFVYMGVEFTDEELSLDNASDAMVYAIEHHDQQSGVKLMKLYRHRYGTERLVELITLTQQKIVARHPQMAHGRSAEIVRQFQEKARQEREIFIPVPEA